MPRFDVDVSIKVSDYFDEMDKEDKDDMIELLLDETDLVTTAVRNEKFIKDIAYHLKYSSSYYLKLLKDELDN